jgi:hypothetical protein
MNGQKIRLKLLYTCAEKFNVIENLKSFLNFGVKASFFIHVGLIHRQHLSFDPRSIHVSLAFVYFVKFFDFGRCSTFVCI